MARKRTTLSRATLASIPAVFGFAALVAVTGNPLSAASNPTCNGVPATIVGTSAAETLTGTNGIDVIVGFGGNDRILGFDGADIICGGNGNDEIHGGTGADTIFGGNGNDVIRGNAGKDTIEGQAGNDDINGNLHADIVRGGTGKDVVSGGEGVDQVFGDNEADFLLGGGGPDLLVGGPGRDNIRGGSGNDVIWSDLEGRAPTTNNTVDGGEGNDRIDDLGATAPATTAAPVPTTTQAPATTTTTQAPVRTDVQAYGDPGSGTGVLESDHFEVTVRQNGVDFPSYVNRSENNQTLGRGVGNPEVPLTESQRLDRFTTDSNHWTSFAFDEPVEVRVALTNGTLRGDVEVRPSSAGINARVSGGFATFTITEPGQYSVHGIDGLDRDALLIFADEIDQDAPNPNASNVFTPEEVRANPSLLDRNDAVLYFAPGVHTITQPVVNNGVLNVAATQRDEFPHIPSNTEVYLAGGSYVKGLINVQPQVTNVHIRGTGVLSGFDFPHQDTGWTNHAVNFEGFSRSSNLSVSGITIVDAPKTCILGRAGDTDVDNVKCLTWHRNTDGVSVGAGGSITNSFFKVYDDVIKLFEDDITVDGVTIWHQQTGSAFQLSWNLSGNIEGSRVSNIDIIAVDRDSGRLEQTAGSEEDFPGQDRTDGAINNALVNARNLRGATISDLVFSNIRFDERPFQILQLQLKDHRNGFTSGEGDIDDIVVQNVTAPSAPLVQSYVLDNGEGRITNISQNVRVNGSTLNNYLVNEVTDRS